MRMRRVLLHGGTVISLLGLLVTLTFWGRSYWYVDAVMMQSNTISSAEGTVVLFHYALDSDQTWFRVYSMPSLAPLMPRDDLLDKWGPPAWVGDFLGFAYATGEITLPSRAGRGLHYHYFEIPFWFLAIVCTIFPAYWLKSRGRRVRVDRVSAGKCAWCGYDLWAHQAGERCPECGHGIEKVVRV